MIDEASTLSRLALECAARMPATPASFRDDAVHFHGAWHDLLSAVRRARPDLMFDLEGRPAAIAAIRSALPAMEAELLDAVLEDVACELAATREALYLVAAAQAGRRT